MFPRRRVRIITTGLLLLFSLCSLALADDPIFHVARISLIEGEVSYKQGKDSGDSAKDSQGKDSGDSAKDWFDAIMNLPLEENDQLYSGSDGRAEIQLSGRNVVRIDHDTNLRFIQFKPGAIQMALSVGSAYFRIDSLDKRKFDIVDANDPGIDDPVYFEIDTPTVAVTFVKEGVYRINVREDGSTEVIVRQGEAEVYNQEIDTVVVRKDRRVVVEGRGDVYQINGLEDEDDWDRWNGARDKGLTTTVASSASASYIPEAIPGAYDLDNYGEWIDTEEYGRVWCPRGVDNDWAPYRDGYWRWFPSYGWTWVSSEPWGWAPYHYGRWAYVRDRWCWGPFINISIGSDWRWRPHHVAFFGWGGDYNRGYRDGYYDGYWNGFRDGRYGWLGWCPLSPRDRRYGPKDHPRFEALGNFRARGGVSGMDARHFTGGRVHVARALLNAPALHDARRGEKGFAAPAFVRNDDLKPLQRITPTRSEAVSHGRFARKIESPIIFRRNPAGGAFPSPRPNRDGRDGRDNRDGRDGRDNRDNRDGRDGRGGRDGRDERTRDGQRTSAPVGPGSDSNRSEPERNPNNRGDRPLRMPDFKPPERGAAPPPRSRESRESGDSRERNDKRDGDSRERRNERARDNDGTPRNEGPRRDERRSDDERRRPDQPDRPNDRPNFERRESPRQGDDRREMRRPDPPPSHDNSPRPETRRPDPPPSRDNSPRQEMRRPDPPPSRDNSPRQEMRRPDPPPRAPERQSSPPPARESSPSRPAERPSERSGPRKPNIQ
jgi:hypothetical protein